MADKKPFSWDTEKVVGEFNEGEKVRHVVKECTLDGVDWVSIQKNVLTKNGWEVKKNLTMKTEVFKQVAAIVLT